MFEGPIFFFFLFCCCIGTVVPHNMKSSVPSIKISPGGPSFSKLVYGTWRLADDGAELAKPENVLERIKACLRLGITTFDLADIYGMTLYA